MGVRLDQRWWSLRIARIGLSQVYDVYLLRRVLLHASALDQGERFQRQSPQLQADLWRHLLRVSEWDSHIGKLPIFRLQNAHHPPLQALLGLQAIQWRIQSEREEDKAPPVAHHLPEIHELSDAHGEIRSSSGYRDMIRSTLLATSILHMKWVNLALISFIK